MYPEETARIPSSAMTSHHHYMKKHGDIWKNMVTRTRTPKSGYLKVPKKPSGKGGTEFHFHVVDSCQICHLSNYTINPSPGRSHNSSNQEQGSDSGPTPIGVA